MKLQRIYSKNADYQKFEVLKTNRNKRYKYSEFFVEGVRNINEAINNNWTIVSFIYSFENDLSNWAENIISTTKTEINFELTNDLMCDLSGKQDTSEIMAIIKMRDDNSDSIALSPKPMLAIFDRPSNKGNLGTIIRSCDALGIDGLIITGHAVDLYDPDVIISSMGSFFKVPVIRFVDNTTIENWINDLKNKFNDLMVIGTTAHAEKNIYELDLTIPFIFMIGNETDGLCNKYKEIADIMTTIPMNPNGSATSFNVACASTVLFYEANRQRNMKVNNL